MPIRNPYLTVPIGSRPSTRPDLFGPISAPPGAKILPGRTMEQSANFTSNPYATKANAPARVMGPTPSAKAKIPKAPNQYIDEVKYYGYKNPYTGDKGTKMTIHKLNPEWTAWDQKYGSGAGKGTTEAAPASTTQSKGDTLTTEYQNAFNEAKAANEKRYGDISNQYGTQRADYEKRLATGMGYLDTAGVQQSKDIAANWEAEKGKGVQNLVDSGMYNSTIQPTMKMGYETQKQADLARLNENLNQQRLQTYGQLSGDALSSNQRFLNFQENRTDAYPDAEMYAKLMQQAGQTSAGTGTTSGGGGVTTGGGTFATIKTKSTPFVGDVEKTRQFRNSPKVINTLPSTPKKQIPITKVPTNAAPKKAYVPMVDKSYTTKKTKKNEWREI